jgi:hypothetical protein
MNANFARHHGNAKLVLTVAVIMRKVIGWKQKDRYTAGSAILLQHREQVEGVLNRYTVKW